MNTSDNKPNKWSEGDVDRLLTDFFAQEMPTELRLSGQPGLPSLQARSKSDRPGRMVWAVLTATAAALMFAVIVTRSTTPDSAPVDSIVNSKLVPTDPAVPVTDRIETNEGTVELKTWLVDEKDNDPGMDLRGLHIDIEYEVEPDSDDSDSDDPDSVKKPSADSRPVPDID